MPIDGKGCSLKEYSKSIYMGVKVVKFVFSLLFIFAASANLDAKNLFYGSLGFGVDFPGSLKFNNMNEGYISKYETGDKYISVNMEYYLDTGNFLEIGLGVMGIYPRNIQNGTIYNAHEQYQEEMPSYYFIPVYATAKITPISVLGKTEEVDLYLGGKVGYNFGFDYESYINCKGYRKFKEPTFFAFSVGLDVTSYNEKTKKFGYGFCVDVAYRIYKAYITHPVFQENDYEIQHSNYTLNFSFIF
ncbi:MAG: hypothetical protein ACLFQX_10815 [Candidatus Kapaibacterium sp.]